MTDKNATPVLDVIADMTAASIEATELDPAQLVALRFSALVALDAAPESYLFHLAAGADTGLTVENAQQILMALAPLVGTARVVSASTKIAEAFGMAIAISAGADR
jgi:hypothetical protein